MMVVENLPGDHNFSQLSSASCEQITTPALLLSKQGLEHNLVLLQQLRQQSGAQILLALKAFACWPLFTIIRDYLDGVCASGLWEAMLGQRHFGKQIHCYSPAYTTAEIDSLLPLLDHLIFNSLTQYRQFKPKCQQWPAVKLGMRVNLETPVVATPLYDPSAAGSRLGLKKGEFCRDDLTGISGLHFHNLCEQHLPALQTSLAAFASKFSCYFDQLEWVNWGGGHLITSDDYDRAGLISLIKDFRQRYGLAVILEPGTAVVLNSGVLLTRVLDVIPGEPPTAILDTSVTCHMPDVLEMPYRPRIWGAGDAGELPYNYRLGGLSCLAGDCCGSYSFPQPLQQNQLLIFSDMAHYTSVKTTTFNGIQLPDLWLYDNGDCRRLRQFNYQDFAGRLG